MVSVQDRVSHAKLRLWVGPEGGLSFHRVLSVLEWLSHIPVNLH